MENLLPKNDSSRQNAISGSLLGIAVGDALGLPLERLTPQRARKIFGAINAGFGMHLFCGRGLVSDDTEHAIFTLQDFVASHGDNSRFEKDLARRMKKWLCLLPPGTGMATAKSCLKLLFGISPSRAGVYSAGNGPAMRAPILGVLANDDDQLKQFVRVCTQITHTDPKAELGALAIAFAARCASTSTRFSPPDFFEKLPQLLDQPDRTQNYTDGRNEFMELLEKVAASLERGQSTPEFALSLGLNHGVSGYIYHTVPVCLHAWLSHQNDFSAAVVNVLRCGGDADSTAAIVGGIVGAQVGENRIPAEWRDKIIEWPRTVSWMQKVAYAAAESCEIKTPLWFVPATFVRNLLLLVIVLLHGFRRLLPPY